MYEYKDSYLPSWFNFSLGFCEHGYQLRLQGHLLPVKQHLLYYKAHRLPARSPTTGGRATLTLLQGHLLPVDQFWLTLLEADTLLEGHLIPVEQLKLYYNVIIAVEQLQIYCKVT